MPRISGAPAPSRLPKFDKATMLSHFDAGVHPQIELMLARLGCNGVIVCCNQDLWALNCGHTTAVGYGPHGFSLRSPLDAIGWHLGDLPSRREYPIGYYHKEGV